MEHSLREGDKEFHEDGSSFNRKRFISGISGVERCMLEISTLEITTAVEQN